MYDVIIIGAGPAGIAAAQNCLNKGLSVVLFEDKVVGGTCLNRGCIPTKFFIKNFSGITSTADVISTKNKLIAAISKTLNGQLLKSGINVVNATAHFKDEHTVVADGKEYVGKNIIIATGSSARSLEVKGAVCISPEALLSSDFSAENYLIIGGGVIGVEYAFLLNQLNKKVTIVESQERILSGLDFEVVNKVLSLLKRLKIKVLCGDKSSDVDYDSFDCIIAAVGRMPNTQHLALDRINIDTDNGWIHTDDVLRTSCNNIYACGDVRGVNLYAYTAEQEAKFIVEHIVDNTKTYSTGPIPKCIFGQISVASVGASEEQLLADNVTYNKKVKNFIEYAVAHVYDDKQGMIKVLSDEHGDILGAHIVSRYAAELIGYFSLAIQQRINVADLSKTLYLHPSISELISKIWE